MGKIVIIMTRVFEATTRKERELLLKQESIRIITHDSNTGKVIISSEPGTLLEYSGSNIVMAIEVNPDSAEKKASNQRIIELFLNRLSPDQLQCSALICHPGCSKTVRDVMTLFPELKKILLVGRYSVCEGLGEFDALLGYWGRIENSDSVDRFNEALENLYHYIRVASRQRLSEDFRHISHYLSNKLSFLRISLQMKVQNLDDTFNEDTNLIIEQIHSHIFGTKDAPGLCNHGFTCLTALAEHNDFAHLEGLNLEVQNFIGNMGFIVNGPNNRIDLSENSMLFILISRLGNNDSISKSDLASFDQWFEIYKENIFNMKNKISSAL